MCSGKCLAIRRNGEQFHEVRAKVAKSLCSRKDTLHLVNSFRVMKRRNNCPKQLSTIMEILCNTIGHKYSVQYISQRSQMSIEYLNVITVTEKLNLYFISLIST